MTVSKREIQIALLRLQACQREYRRVQYLRPGNGPGIGTAFELDMDHHDKMRVEARSALQQAQNDYRKLLKESHAHRPLHDLGDKPENPPGPRGPTEDAGVSVGGDQTRRDPNGAGLPDPELPPHEQPGSQPGVGPVQDPDPEGLEIKKDLILRKDPGRHHMGISAEAAAAYFAVKLRLLELDVPWDVSDSAVIEYLCQDPQNRLHPFAFRPKTKDMRTGNRGNIVHGRYSGVRYGRILKRIIYSVQNRKEVTRAKLEYFRGYRDRVLEHKRSRAISQRRVKDVKYNKDNQEANRPEAPPTVR